MPRLTGRHTTEHVAAFHVSDAFIIHQAAAFIAAGLRGREHVIALATQRHWNVIAKHVEQVGVALGRATADGRLVLIEADQMIEMLTVSGHVDADVFRATLEPLIKPGVKVRIYGEVVSLLAAKGDVEGALAIERLGHELARTLKLNVLCGYHLSGARPLQTSDIERLQSLHDRSIFEQGPPDGRSAKPAAAAHVHAVRFYQDSHSLARIVTQFLDEGLSIGSPAIVIATPEHREAIEASLSARGVDVSRLRQSDDLIIADADAALSKFMHDGVPDAALFRATIVPLIERACRGRTGCVVRAYGEMVDVLWKDGHADAAIRLETMWNQLAQSHEFALLCGYSMGHFYKAAALRELHDLHTHVSSDDADSAAFVH
jgi:hypothetical protein